MQKEIGLVPWLFCIQMLTLKKKTNKQTDCLVYWLIVVSFAGTI